MIARVTASQAVAWTPDSEAALRQCGQFAAYGADRDFMRFYTDDNGNRLSVLDDAAVLHAVSDTEEMRLFLTMDPTVRTVRTDEHTAALLAQDWQTSFLSEAVMQAPTSATRSLLVQTLTPREIYPVLQEGFGEAIPPFEAWYADVHHRYRHGLCRVVGVMENDKPVACAMTVAECDLAALIGAVATTPDARGKGYASACVLTLSAMLQEENKRVLLSPKNEYAHRLYDRIGFTVIGRWGSVNKPL